MYFYTCIITSCVVQFIVCTVSIYSYRFNTAAHIMNTIAINRNDFSICPYVRRRRRRRGFLLFRIIERVRITTVSVCSLYRTRVRAYRSRTRRDTTYPRPDTGLNSFLSFLFFVSNTTTRCCDVNATRRHRDRSVLTRAVRSTP